MAWSARYHHRMLCSSLASTAGRLTNSLFAIHQNNNKIMGGNNLSACAIPRFNTIMNHCERASKRFMVSNEYGGDVVFRPGDKIQVEVVNFGPLGASVEVIGLGHGDDVPLLPADAPEAYGYGLILQKEISYFRNARNNIDVVRGEILPAYVQKVRLEDGKLDISLRSYGGKAKSMDAGTQILERLEEVGGRLDIGEKSTPQEINDEFPGVSKSVFKKVTSNTGIAEFRMLHYSPSHLIFSLPYSLLSAIVRNRDFSICLTGTGRIIQKRFGETRKDINRTNERIILV